MKIFLYTITLLTALISVSASAGTPTRFAPYADITINSHWDPHYQDMEPMDLNSISKASGIKHYNLAFITDAGNCNPAWGAESSYATSTRWGSHLTDALRASNVDYTIALGGANGNDISKACTNTDLLKAYEQIITLYQPTGLDFDIENGSADIPKIMATLVNIQRNHPQLTIRFTLPTLPDG
jgi:chitinase